MSILFVEYPKCSTCKKAEKWLREQGIDFESRHITEENPTAEELSRWHKKSGLGIKRFINTSGMKYRELGLKDKLLATDGMLVKRPVIVSEDFVLPGFKEAEWKEKLGV